MNVTRQSSKQQARRSGGSGRTGPHPALLTWLLLLAWLLPLSPIHAQELDLDARVDALLATMSVEERVGQVFLVAFVGNDPSPGTDIAQLVRQDHIGGVVLLAANSNFYNDATTPRQVAELTNGLQALAMRDGAQVPLFVAVDHEGDGYPYTRITGGTTPLPNAMTIGATWDPANARAVGQITGRELTAMGVNLLLGPVVDVLDDPRPSGQGDIGTRTFGGDPWWVGQMGRAYIEGVHQGSSGRVATVAKHFPGHGGSDRLPDEEVATVDKSLEQLKQVELAPFFALVQEQGSPDAVTDALMSSHIRYRGVQGDVRQFTAPISFDAQGMGDILALDEFAAWRPTGLIVSDSLGVPAVRKYFDPTLTTFPHRRIAKEALLAGNDLLLLSQFDLNNVWADQFANIRDTVAFFQDEYRANPTFAARVDEAVAKILRLKLTLYPDFSLEAVQVHADAATQVCGLGEAVTQRIANQALTLLYPDTNALPAPPRRGEKILIFTDARPVRECFTEQCQPFTPLSQTAVEEAILRSYGPQGTGQIDAGDIASLPFGQLKLFLSGGETQYDVGALLAGADWVIFAPQDLNPVKGPNSDAIELFLNDARSAAYDARYVVLAFNAPYYLDTTEISKLSLYLAAYSKVDASIEAAVRALFGEQTPRGVPPVDVIGINYDLQRRLAPDPDQTIPLAQLAPAPDALLLPPLSVHLQAGPILDRNGHVVPDGTQVAFYAEYDSGTYAPPQSATTTDGLAEASLSLTAAGQVRFRAESGEATRSGTVSLLVEALPTETPAPTSTPAPGPPTATPTSTTSAVPSPSPMSTATAGPVPIGSTRPVDGTDLLLAAGTTALATLVGLDLLGRRRRPATVVRWLALAFSGGMAGYLLYALQIIRPETWGLLPEAAWVARVVVGVVAAVGALLPLAAVLRMREP
jgi:beta-N-acetylhexosaminidase